MDREAWRAVIHGVTKSQTRLSYWSDLKGNQIRIFRSDYSEYYIWISESEYSLEGLILNWSSNSLTTWCKELTQWKRPWCWETLKTGEEGWQMVRWHHKSMDMSLSKLRGIVKNREAWCAAVHGVAKNWTWLSIWSGEGNGTLLQYFCLENPMDRGAWWAAVLSTFPTMRIY